MSDVFTAALVGGVIGTFFGGFTKFLWERWLPEWLTWRRTQRIDRERELSAVRAPAIRAFSELHFRIEVIVRDQASNYRYVQSLGDGDYYVDSTAYLIGRAFAWQEILRRRMANYDYAELYTRLESITQAFSHGGPGFQVFRLQQTEIGERLTATTDTNGITCVMLSDFIDSLQRESAPRCILDLRSRVVALLEHPVEELERAVEIDKSLAAALHFLDPKGRWHDGSTIEPITVESIVQTWLDRHMISPAEAKMILDSSFDDAWRAVSVDALSDATPSE